MLEEKKRRREEEKKRRREEEKKRRREEEKKGRREEEKKDYKFGQTPTQARPSYKNSEVFMVPIPQDPSSFLLPANQSNVYHALTEIRNDSKNKHARSAWAAAPGWLAVVLAAQPREAGGSACGRREEEKKR